MSQRKADRKASRTRSRAVQSHDSFTTAERSRVVRHIVRHVHWGPGLFGMDECTTVLSARIRVSGSKALSRTARGSSKAPSPLQHPTEPEALERATAVIRSLRPIVPRGVVLSTIITGPREAVYYGSESPTIKRQVDRLVPRIKAGQCFSGGPIQFDRIQRQIFRTPKQDAAHLHRASVLGEIYFEVTSEKVDSIKGRPIFGGWLKGDPDDPSTWTRADPPSHLQGSLWHLYQTAAPSEVESEFISRCRSLRIFSSCATHGDRLAAGRLMTLHDLLGERRRDPSGKMVPAFQSAIDLSIEIAARVILRCHTKTLRRMVVGTPDSSIQFR